MSTTRLTIQTSPQPPLVAELAVVPVAAVAAVEAEAPAVAAPVATEVAAEAVAEENTLTNYQANKTHQIVWSHTCQTFAPARICSGLFLAKTQKNGII